MSIREFIDRRCIECRIVAYFFVCRGFFLGFYCVIIKEIVYLLEIVYIDFVFCKGVVDLVI